MIITTKRNDLPFDEASYELIEYEDLFALNDKKKLKIKDLGKKVASTNAFFYEYLKEYHIPTAFHRKESDNALKFLSSKEYPFRIKILNSADKRNAKIFNIKENSELALPIFEFHYGFGKESVVCESHLISFDLCSVEDLKLITRICSKVNAVLRSFFERRNEIMAEISVYFGKLEDKVFVIGDFSPASLKIYPKEVTSKSINPYKLSTPGEVKKYTDHLFSIASVK